MRTLAIIISVIFFLSLTATSSAAMSVLFQNTTIIRKALTVSASASLPAIAGQPISFTCKADGGVPNFTFSWDFGDGTTGKGQHPSHTYSSAGTFSVTCTVVDSQTTSASTTFLLVVA